MGMVKVTNKPRTNKEDVLVYTFSIFIKIFLIK